MPDDQDITPEMQATHFWMGEVAGYKPGHRLEKIVERGSGRVIWEDDRRALGVENFDEELRATLREPLPDDYPDLEHLLDEDG